MDQPQKAMAVLLVRPKTISRKDIERAERIGGICIVECADPESARFVEAPALVERLEVQARAALWLLRRVVEGQEQQFSRGELTKWFVGALLDGKRPDPAPSVRSAPTLPTKR